MAVTSNGIATKAVSTSTTPAVLVAGNNRRRSLVICNEDATNAVRIGPSTVTNSGGAAGTRGLRLAAGIILALTDQDLGDTGITEDIYVIADAGTPTVSVLEVIA